MHHVICTSSDTVDATTIITVYILLRLQFSVKMTEYLDNWTLHYITVLLENTACFHIILKCQLLRVNFLEIFYT